jgi:ribosomal protein S18 acetylase RimI-like enzyme
LRSGTNWAQSNALNIDQITRNPMPSSNSACLVRNALADDAARIGAIARAGYTKYIARIGREPAPMVADFAAAIAAEHVTVIETDGVVAGYMIAWPKSDAYFIENIAIDPAQQGKGLGRQLIDHAVGKARHLHLPAIYLYTNAAMTENLSMYAHFGFVETHRAREKGFDRVYLRLTVPEGRQRHAC